MLALQARARCSADNTIRKLCVVSAVCMSFLFNALVRLVDAAHILNCLFSFSISVFFLSQFCFSFTFRVHICCCTDSGMILFRDFAFFSSCSPLHSQRLLFHNDFRSNTRFTASWMECIFLDGFFSIFIFLIQHRNFTSLWRNVLTCCCYTCIDPILPIVALRTTILFSSVYIRAWIRGKYAP